MLLTIFAPETIPTFWINAIFFVPLGICYWLNQRAQVQVASLVLCGTFWLLLVYYLTISGGTASPSFGLIYWIIIVGAVLMGVRGAVGFGLLAALTTVALYWSQNNGWLPPLEEPVTASRLIGTQILTVLFLTILLGIGGRSLGNALRQAWRDEHLLAERNQQLQQEIAEREQSQEAYRTLVEHSLQGLIIFQDNRIIFANPTIAEMGGYSVAELCAMEDATLLVHPDDRRQVASYLDGGFIEQPVTEHYEFRILRKDGTVRWVEVFSAKIDYRNKPAIQTAFIDITERKEAYFRHQEIEEEFRQLSNAAFEGIVVSEQGQIIVANQQLAKMLGCEHSELIGKRVMDFVAPESREYVLKQVQSGYEGIYDHLALRADGTIFPVEVHGRTMIYGGRKVRVTALRDITDRKKAEAQMIDLAHHRERIDSLTEFLGNISHDLKTPLTIIKTSLYLLERLEDPAKQKDRLRQIQNQTLRLEKFIQDILVMSRLDNTPQLADDAVDLNQLLDGIAQELQPKALQKSIEVKREFQADLPLLHGSTEELSRVFVNLVENALNYTPDNGRVTLATYVEAENIVTKISDTGIGISEADLPHVFDRFYRGTRAKKLESGGSGLGLAIVKKVIDRHQGTIEVQSVVGEGSMFSVLLPGGE